MAADLENAFNSISRSAIFRALKGDPKLLPLEGITLFSYGKTGSLHLGEGTSILSSRGVKQGDPMTPILFAIGIHGAIAKVAAKFPGTLKVWAYLDDVTLAGEPKVCGAALEALQGEIKSLGLRLNVAKCKVATRQNEAFSEFLKTRMVHSPGGVKLLGAFIGEAEAREEEWVLTKAPKVISFLEKLEDLPRAVRPATSTAVRKPTMELHREDSRASGYPSSQRTGRQGRDSMCRSLAWRDGPLGKDAVRKSSFYGGFPGDHPLRT